MTYQPKSPELAARILDLIELSKTLSEDAAEALELYRFATPEFCARTMVRTLSADYEARIHFLAELLLGLYRADSKSFALTENEVQILKSTTVNIKRDGAVSESQRFYPFRERMLFVLKLAARILNPGAAPDTQDKRWVSVKRFIGIRNRLTHPKKANDLHITDEEIDQLNAAQDWIRDSIGAIFHIPELDSYMKAKSELGKNETKS